MSIFGLLISLVIYALIFYCFWWALGAIGIEEPFNKVIRVILVIAALIVIVGLLTGGIAPFGFLGTTVVTR